MKGRFLNIGCGPWFIDSHEWLNIDINPCSEKVLPLHLGDVASERSGLLFDGIYSSHLIEHLSRSEAQQHLRLCFDYLREGGCLRILTPDFESLVEAYIKHAALGDFGKATVEKILLLEQCVRLKKGGWFREGISNLVCSDSDIADYTYVRCGEHVIKGKSYNEKVRPIEKRTKFVLRKIRKLKKQIDSLMVFCSWKLLPKKYRDNLALVDAGELHKWIYSEYELAQMARNIGFTRVVRRSAGFSNMFVNAELEFLEIDAAGNHRKGDSTMYLEFEK